jgi:hypothetical protein
VTLSLGADEAFTLSTDYQNGEAPVVQLGEWGSDEDGAMLTLTITGTAESVYNEPGLLVFEVGEDGSLDLAEDADNLYGSEGVTLNPVDTDSAMAAADEVLGSAEGVYVSRILPSDGDGQVVFMILFPDGALQANTYFLDKEPPVMEVGAWNEAIDGSVAVTVTGSVAMSTTGAIVEEYVEPQPLVFERAGETLTYLSLELTRLEKVETVSERQPVSWFQTEVMESASSPGRQLSLILYDDGSAEMVSDTLNGEDPIVESGVWEATGDGGVTVTLTGRGETVYETPVTIPFAAQVDESLVATEWDEMIYGSEPLVLTLQDVEELSQSEVPQRSSADAAGVSDYEVPTGAIAVFRSGVMRSASTPGLVKRLVLFEDGTAQMVSDYLNGEAAVIELGTWQEESEASFVVSLTGPIGRPYRSPDVLTFARADGGVSATEFDADIYGSEGFTMTTEFLGEAQ